MRRGMDECNLGEQLAVDIDGLAMLLDVREADVFQMHQAGKLPAPVRIGEQERWRVAEIREWLAAGCPAGMQNCECRMQNGRRPAPPAPPPPANDVVRLT